MKCAILSGGSVSDYAGMFLCGDQPLTVITSDNKRLRYADMCRLGA